MFQQEHRFIFDELESYFLDRFRAERVAGHEDFCDRYYKAHEFGQVVAAALWISADHILVDRISLK